MSHKSSKNTVQLVVTSDKDPICVTEWSSCGIPVKENKIEVNINQDEKNDKKLQLVCRDPSNEIKYGGEQFDPKYEKYMVAVVEGDKAILKTCVYFKMKPLLDLPKRVSGSVSSLTIREQIDECNEKFGSKRSLKQIEQRKKYAINFGEDDYADMKDKASKLVSESVNPAKETKGGDMTSSDILSDSFLMPPRNSSAVSVKEVYNIYDIVAESTISIIKSNYDLATLNQYLTSQLLQNYFSSKAKDELNQCLCIYLDLLITLKSMKAAQLGKIGLQKIPGIECSELQDIILENYTVSALRNNKMKRTLTDKCKDKIIIHGLIISLFLNNFKPLIISLLAQAFQTSTVKLRKLANIVGCYIETSNNRSEKVFNFKLPLYSLDYERNPKRRRVR